MNKVLTLIQLFNFADWIIALFIAGTAARIQGRDGRRTSLAVALAVFFGAFGLIRVCEFVNLVFHSESLRACIGMVATRFSRNSVIISGVKTTALLFCWFGVTQEMRDRQGLLSGNVIRNFLTRWFDKLR